MPFGYMSLRTIRTENAGTHFIFMSKHTILYKEQKNVHRQHNGMSGGCASTEKFHASFGQNDARRPIRNVEAENFRPCLPQIDVLGPQKLSFSTVVRISYARVVHSAF